MVNIAGLLESVGLRDEIAQLYWKTKIHRGFEFTHSIDGVTATFQPDGLTECRRLVSLTEPNILDRFLQDLRPSDVVFDIGANVGEYSAFTSRVVSDGFVAAFDPVPPNAKQCEKHLAQNASCEWCVQQVAVSDKDGSAYLDRESTEAGVGDYSITESSSGTQINVRRIDSLVEDRTLPTPDVVKIDVERLKAVFSGVLAAFWRR